MKIFPFLVSFGICLFLYPASGFAKGAQAFDPTPRIIVQGEGKLTLPADRARLEVGVVTEGRSARSAAARNAKNLEPTLKNLGEILGKKGEIKTIGYSVSPQYQFSKGSRDPKISGFFASSTVLVVVEDLRMVGELIDAATKSGANRIQRLEFTLRDEEKARLQALKLAAREARGKAEAVAAALGLKISKVVIVEETRAGDGLDRPPITAFAARGGSTPIEPGSVEVKASVMMTVEIGE